MRHRYLLSYSGFEKAYARVYEPRTVAELQQILKQARVEQWSVTFRGGGCSFDSQSLNDDTVILLRHLRTIHPPDQGRAQITVESAAQWGKILHRLRPYGLTPHIVVTTSKATAGGTLSADCYSRSSSRYGKEGRHVARFQLLTVDGDLLECNRTENPELFHAVIGGFGYLGVVTEITYNLLRIDERTRVQTVFHKYTSLEGLVKGLEQRVIECQDWDAVYALAFFSGNQEKGFVCHSRYSAERRLRRFFLYTGVNPLRVLAELLIRISWINTLALNIAFRFFIKEDDAYLDKLDGYIFFMESNRVSKGFARRFGIQLLTIQQTFIIPRANLLAFLTVLSTMLRRGRFIPNLFDIIPIPAVDFLMSGSNGLDGFAVSVAFEDVNKGNIAKLREELEAVSAVCAELGGRVHLVKNVCASSEQLHSMYAQTMGTFLHLKKRLDPDGILRNSFFERVFG